ncbi:MAG: hypothetical protein AAF543_23745, partial [Pseudomonadota bacterium]
MSVADGGDRFFCTRLLRAGAVVALLLSSASQGEAEPANSPSSSDMPTALDGSQTMEELRVHASTIADILAEASKRVDELAADDAASSALMDAIRQELALSRRWNHHLGTILDDVTEARRALGAREREAAKEITRLTVAAEEARLELVALKRVLSGPPIESEQHDKAWSEGRLDDEVFSSLGRQSALRPPAARVEAKGDSEFGDRWDRSALRDARATLLIMQESQKSAVRDVDAVRAKIIEALQT